MTRIRPDQLLLPSVLDRLMDDEPHVTTETLKSRSQLLRELKQSVRRDLENLLNTRVCLKALPRDLDHLKVSMVNYGIPDFGGLAMGNLDHREVLRVQVEEAIRNFETRFSHVTVELIHAKNFDTDRTIRFRIDGLLYAEPTPEPVVFDSQLVATSQEFQVRSQES